MAQTPRTGWKAALWSGDLIVAAVFLTLWVMVVVRLCVNYAGEYFLTWHWDSVRESSFVIVVPFVILIRVLHYRKGLKARRA